MMEHKIYLCSFLFLGEGTIMYINSKRLIFPCVDNKKKN